MKHPSLPLLSALALSPCILSLAPPASLSRCNNNNAPCRLPRKTSRSTSLFSAPSLDKAEELYPSDDSDYAQGGTSAPPRLTIDVYDPFEVVADWVSDRFVDVSLTGVEGSDEISSEEEYEEGTILDFLARASPRTPLSYQVRTLVRVVLPSLVFAVAGALVYPSLANSLVQMGNGEFYDDGVLAVLSNDLSQYVQNILTTCALVFGMIVGQTYYFMYQQQEMVFFSLFAEVTEAKSLLEQVSLMSAGRSKLYQPLLARIDDYVKNDLKRLSVLDPTAATARRPVDDPLESILYATSVGEPGSMYDTVMSLRQARADRCGALQRKLPDVHMVLLRVLAVVVLSAFPVCGSGSQAIDVNVLDVQAYGFGILVFELTLILNVVEELRRPRRGAYNVDGVLGIMVRGLESELRDRMSGKVRALGASPSLPGEMVGWMAQEQQQEEHSFLEGEEEGMSVEGEGGVETSSSKVSRRSQLKKWLRRKVLRRL